MDYTVCFVVLIDLDLYRSSSIVTQTVTHRLHARAAQAWMDIMDRVIVLFQI